MIGLKWSGVSRCDQSCMKLDDIKFDKKNSRNITSFIELHFVYLLQHLLPKGINKFTQPALQLITPDGVTSGTLTCLYLGFRACDCRPLSLQLRCSPSILPFSSARIFKQEYYTARTPFSLFSNGRREELDVDSLETR